MNDVLIQLFAAIALFNRPLIINNIIIFLKNYYIRIRDEQCIFYCMYSNISIKVILLIVADLNNIGGA